MATDLVSATTIVSLGFTVALVVLAWIITEALTRTFHLKRPHLDYWIILWLTWDALIHFILASFAHFFHLNMVLMEHIFQMKVCVVLMLLFCSTNILGRFICLFFFDWDCK